MVATINLIAGIIIVFIMGAILHKIAGLIGSKIFHFSDILYAIYKFIRKIFHRLGSH